jgi:hypothetical protein
VVNDVELLQAKQAMRDMISIYCFAWDGDALHPSDPVAWADTFTPDGRFESFDNQGAIRFRCRGRDELIAWAAERIGVSPGPIVTKHMMVHTIWDDIQVASATTRTSAMLPKAFRFSGDSDVAGIPLGVYFDTWQRTDAGWRFATRAFHVETQRK